MDHVGVISVTISHDISPHLLAPQVTRSLTSQGTTQVEDFSVPGVGKWQTCFVSTGRDFEIAQVILPKLLF